LIPAARDFAFIKRERRSLGNLIISSRRNFNPYGDCLDYVIAEVEESSTRPVDPKSVHTQAFLSTPFSGQKYERHRAPHHEEVMKMLFGLLLAG